VKTLNYELRHSVAAPRAEAKIGEIVPGISLLAPESFPDAAVAH
jgi:hypothetical protein